MDTIEKENIDFFVKKYFTSLRIKQFLITAILCIITTYLTKGKEDIVINIVLILIINPFAFFIFPNFLGKETEKSIQEIYNKTLKHDNALTIICNCKKFNGPTFGVLHIDEKMILFKPFRENLQNESFCINQTGIKNTKISLLEIKSSVFNRIFFKELTKVINISSDNINVSLQTPLPERTIEKIRKRI
ncbi:hypothetical protein OW763_14230 [Clostridium aestuarii]|uniref:YokE-like PH domain-containing protein n=1 Tax=Clostridium aestuarii TaxID=338193 RepID=A0ABT4D2M0_9CLOT|nr:hypothetical protein [Clostridium aestuarii]MCY6485488.1 hypothetical protein [Clostridium aestuarii]